jgi:hypothetical protein
MDSMTRERTTEQRLTDWLISDAPSQLPDRVLEDTFQQTSATRQVRPLPGWRTFRMDRNVISFAAGAAAIAFVVIAGAAYFGQPDASGVGAAPTPTPTPTPVTPGITGWTPYTSPIYGYTISYPSDWSVSAQANHKWQPGETEDEDWPTWADIFVNNEEVDGDSIAMSVNQVPAPPNADLESWDGLYAAHQQLCDEPTMKACPADYTPTPLCVGEQVCAPALLALIRIDGDPFPAALIGDPEKGSIMVIQMGRVDSFPAAARYGGSTALLNSILSQMDVRDPLPGETPH